MKKLKKGQVRLSNKLISDLAYLFGVEQIYDPRTESYTYDHDLMQQKFYQLSVILKEELFRTKLLTFPDFMRVRLKNSTDGVNSRLHYQSLLRISQDEEQLEELRKLKDLVDDPQIIMPDIASFSLKELQDYIMLSSKTKARGRVKDYSKLLKLKANEKIVPEVYTGYRGNSEQISHSKRFTALCSLAIGDIIDYQDMITLEKGKCVIYDIVSTVFKVYKYSNPKVIGTFRRADGLTSGRKAFVDCRIVFEDEALNLIPDRKNPRTFLNIID